MDNERVSKTGESVKAHNFFLNQFAHQNTSPKVSIEYLSGKNKDNKYLSSKQNNSSGSDMDLLA